MKPFFVGTHNKIGNGGTGYMVLNNGQGGYEIYGVTTGGSIIGSDREGLKGESAACAPEGDYPIRSDEPVRKDQETMYNEDYGPWSSQLKFRLGGTGKGGPGPGPAGSHWDPDRQRYRTDLLFHLDGKLPGTEGCFGYADPAAQKTLLRNEGQVLNASYIDTAANPTEDLKGVQAEIEKRLKTKNIPWNKIKPPRVMPGGWQPGKPSKTKKGSKGDHGEKTVLLGPKHREALHIDALLTGGAKVTHGSQTVRLGRAQKPMSGVGDMTTDGSPIDDGEVSVQFV